MDTTLLVSIILLAWLLYSAFMMRQQQNTIDRLTDKLMARDYGEYKRHEKRTEREEEKTRKPLSYYDDNSVDVDEVQ